MINFGMKSSVLCTNIEDRLSIEDFAQSIR